MITNMDWLEESELRKYQVALKADAALVDATTYPTVAKVHSLNQCSKCKRVNYGYSYG